MPKIRFRLAGLALGALASAAAADDMLYSFKLSALAQHYYQLCRADARLQEQLSRDFNERQLPIPPTTSPLAHLPTAEQRDAQLVCLGAAAQRFEDLQSPPVAVLPPDVAPRARRSPVAPAAPAPAATSAAAAR